VNSSEVDDGGASSHNDAPPRRGFHEIGKSLNVPILQPLSLASQSEDHDGGASCWMKIREISSVMMFGWVCLSDKPVVVEDRARHANPNFRMRVEIGGTAPYALQYSMRDG
jgi:hypothetical protein